MKTWLKKILMSDKRRYGVKYTISEQIIVIICLIVAIALIVGMLLSKDTKLTLFYGAMALLVMMPIPYMYIPAYKRRIRELGGDVLHKVDKNGSENTSNR